jgi:hypothetical protein
LDPYSVGRMGTWDSSERGSTPNKFEGLRATRPAPADQGFIFPFREDYLFWFSQTVRHMELVLSILRGVNLRALAGRR